MPETSYDFRQILNQKHQQKVSSDDYQREYVLSEVAKASIWAELARITPALKPAAAKVLTWLTAEALRRGSTSLRASCRDVAEGSGCSKSNTIPAVAALVAMGAIAKREGTARTPAAYMLRFAETLRFSGPKTGPPSTKGGLARQDHSGPVTGPLNSENAGLFELEPGVQSIDSSALQITRSIDRSRGPQPEPAGQEGGFPAAEEAHAEECRTLMTAYARHCGRAPHAHPPDRTMIRMMLRVAEWETVEGWLKALLKFNTIEPPPGIASIYAWLIAVALQKIHGIAPSEQKPTLLLMRGGKQLRSKWAEEQDARREAAKKESEWPPASDPAPPWPERRAEYLAATDKDPDPPEIVPAARDADPREAAPPAKPAIAEPASAEEEEEMRKFREHMERAGFAAAAGKRLT